MRIIAYAPILVLFTIACAPATTITRVSKASFPSKPNDCDIQVLTQVPTGRNFEEIAILSTTQRIVFSGNDLNGLLPSIKQTACSLGADAILIKTVNPATQDTYATAFTVAIKFTN
jgi:hypothetical protein